MIDGLQSESFPGTGAALKVYLVCLAGAPRILVSRKQVEWLGTFTLGALGRCTEYPDFSGQKKHGVCLPQARAHPRFHPPLTHR
jgi:hypothetical protein